MRRVTLIACMLVLPVFANAAILPSLYTIEIAVSPTYPKTGELVTLTVHAPSAVSDVTYAWAINGVPAGAGIGQTTLTTTAGAIGSVQTITVEAIENGEVQGQAIAVIRPAEVDIVWEGQTRTPPFYVGLPLPTGMSAVSAVAIPHMMRDGAVLASSNLIYTWKLDRKQISSQSGYGKSSVTVTPPRFAQAFQLSVTAKTPDGAVVAEQSVTIRPVSPRIMMYENAPLSGILFNKEIGGVFQFVSEEVTVAAFPLFVSLESILSYQWKLDGQPFEFDLQTPESATFLKSGTGSGTHAVTFSFDNAAKFLEHATRSFQLSF